MSRISTRPIILPGFTFGRRPNSYTLTISPMIPRKHQHSPKKSTNKSIFQVQTKIEKLGICPNSIHVFPMSALFIDPFLGTKSIDPPLGRPTLRAPRPALASPASVAAVLPASPQHRRASPECIMV